MTSLATDPAAPPEYNATGHDYARREHFTYAGPPIIDIHTHVTMTSPEDKAAGPAGGWGDKGSSESAAMMLDVGAEFGIGLTVSMCPPQDIAPLRARLGDRLLFNGMINKKPDEPDDAAYRNLDQFLEAGEALGQRLGGTGCRPASTLLGVTRLAFPEMLVEIEATAVA